VLRNLPVLETGRLRLRRARLEDADQMYLYGSNPRISPYIYHYPIQSRAHAVSHVRQLLRQYTEGLPAEWVVEHRATRQVIGTCGYTKFDAEDRRAEIGFILAEEWQRQGLMREAVREVIRFSFEETNLHRLEARCATENQASRTLLEDCGFQQEGLFRRQLYLKDRYHDVAFFGLLVVEYERHPYWP
jgi:ribosomal-protein-alanine N-acetyltransferase